MIDFDVMEVRVTRDGKDQTVKRRVAYYDDVYKRRIPQINPGEVVLWVIGSETPIIIQGAPE